MMKRELKRMGMVGAMVALAFGAAGTDEAIEDSKDLFDAANNLGCPLSGTKATK